MSSDRILAREVIEAKRAMNLSAPGTDEHAQAKAWRDRAMAALLGLEPPRPVLRPAAPAPRRAAGLGMTPARWAAAAALLLATTVLAGRYGGDEVEHHRRTEQAATERAAEARFLAAEAAMERDLVTASAGRP
jgi:hypothetical protein